MKKLADYTGADSIELWADLMEPFAKILADNEIQEGIRTNQPTALLLKSVMKKHKKEAEEIVLRVDDTPLNGVNFPVRVLSVLMEIEHSPELAGFFGSQGQKLEESVSGSATENTEDGEN